MNRAESGGGSVKRVTCLRGSFPLCRRCYGYWHERRHTSRNRQRALESSAVPRTGPCACGSSCSAILQFNTPGPFIVITLTILFLHVVSANLLVPKFIATRVSIGPVAATVGMLFWGWLWGVMGLLLAVPLTAFIKLVADLHPSLAVSVLLPFAFHGFSLYRAEFEATHHLCLNRAKSASNYTGILHSAL